MEERLIYIPELQYECYFLGDKWKIFRENKIKDISINSFYGYPFYIVFENIEVASEQLILFMDKHSVSLLDIFPVELILKDIVDNQQGYWLNLNLDFIIKTKCLNENIVKTLTKSMNDKSLSQELRHKIRRIINSFKYQF